MNKLKTLVVSLVLIASSGIAHAVSVSGNMAITSDYIWRGMTQNQVKFLYPVVSILRLTQVSILELGVDQPNFGGGESN